MNLRWEDADHKMKSALILLSVLIVLSKQQMRQSSRDMMYWLSHYYLPHPSAFNHYNNYHPFNYDYNQGFPPFLRRFTSARPMDTVSQDDKEPYGMNTMESTDVLGEDEFPDAQSRIKGFNRHRPLFPAKSPKDPRVVINLASQSNFFTRGVKTITFTVTSSVTITSVQSCIPSAEFFTRAADRTCRRKRRGIVEARGFRSEESQFAIAPSDVQPVETTVLSSRVNPITTAKNSGHLTNDQVVNPETVSSKNEETLTDRPVYASPAVDGSSRGKRLFFHLVTTSTLISYTFIPTTITKTVHLLNTFYYFYGGGQLICRPEGYAVCPYTTQFFG